MSERQLLYDLNDVFYETTSSPAGSHRTGDIISNGRSGLAAHEVSSIAEKSALISENPIKTKPYSQESR